MATEYEAAQGNALEFVRSLGQRLRISRIKLGTDEAAALQLATAAILEVGNNEVPPSLLVTLAETAALIAVAPSTMKVLKICRLASPPVDADEFERWLKGECDVQVGGLMQLASLPVRERSKRTPDKPRDDRNKPRDDGGSQKQASRKCRDCGEDVDRGVSWAEHRKVCPN